MPFTVETDRVVVRSVSVSVAEVGKVRMEWTFDDAQLASEISAAVDAIAS